MSPALFAAKAATAATMLIVAATAAAALHSYNIESLVRLALYFHRRRRRRVFYIYWRTDYGLCAFDPLCLPLKKHIHKKTISITFIIVCWRAFSQHKVIEVTHQTHFSLFHFLLRISRLRYCDSLRGANLLHNNDNKRCDIRCKNIANMSV